MPMTLVMLARAAQKSGAFKRNSVDKGSNLETQSKSEETTFHLPGFNLSNVSINPLSPKTMGATSRSNADQNDGKYYPLFTEDQLMLHIVDETMRGSENSRKGLEQARRDFEGASGKGERIGVYVNGIANNSESRDATIADLKKKLEENGVHREIVGLQDDASAGLGIFQVAAMKLGMNTQGSKELALMIEIAMQNQTGVDLISHSKGTTTSDTAMKIVRANYFSKNLSRLMEKTEVKKETNNQTKNIENASLMSGSYGEDYGVIADAIQGYKSVYAKAKELGDEEVNAQLASMIRFDNGPSSQGDPRIRTVTQIAVDEEESMNHTVYSPDGYDPSRREFVRPMDPVASGFAKKSSSDTNEVQFIRITDEQRGEDRNRHNMKAIYNGPLAKVLSVMEKEKRKKLGK